MKKLLQTLLLFVPLLSSAQDIGGDYYVAVNGNDSNPGTYEKPWGTWQKAFANAMPGDTVYFRGGVWYPKKVASGSNDVILHSPRQLPIIGHNGTSENKICFFNYPGEVPILDCSQLDTIGRRFNGGILFTESSFLYLKGLTITNLLQPQSGELAVGINAYECSNLTFENITISNVGGRGMSYWGVAGHPDRPHILSDTTRYINCDVYNCIDSLSEVPGNGSDGWKLDNESDGYLHFYGCRAWNCGDDGFDISGPGVTVFERCWSFEHNMPGALDGNGFKFGANRGDGAYIDNNGEVVCGERVPGVRKIVKNCIAANNGGIGYYELAYAPYYPNNAQVYNNVSYANGIGIQMATNDNYSGENPSHYYNNIIFESKQIDTGGRPYNLVVGDIYIESNNTWDYADDSEIGSLMWWKENEVEVTADDFESLDVSELSAPRKDDGSLPEIKFMKLKYKDGKSDLIDKGTKLDNYGYDYYGSSPDIGYTEYTERPIEIIEYPKTTTGKASIKFYSPNSDYVNIDVRNDFGYTVKSLNHLAQSGTDNELDINLFDSPTGSYTIYITDDITTDICIISKVDPEAPRPLIINNKESGPNPSSDGLVKIFFKSKTIDRINVEVFDNLGTSLNDTGKLEIMLSDLKKLDENEDEEGYIKYKYVINLIEYIKDEDKDKNATYNIVLSHESYKESIKITKTNN